MSRKKTNGLREGEPPKTPKVWEKARREKMKTYFNELQEVLPLYDPSAPMSRFEILQKSRTYIKELQSQNQDLLNGGFDEVYKTKMEKLKQRVKELLQRVDQLTDLLRRANIMVPPLVPCLEKQESVSLSQKWMNQQPRKWTEKLNVVVPDEKIENILSMIKDFKKKKSKPASVRKTCKTDEKPVENKGLDESNTKKASFSERIELKKKQLKSMKEPKLAKIKEANSDKGDKTSSDGFTDSQSPSHTKENQPVDFNLPETEGITKEKNDNNVRDKTSEDKSNSADKVKCDDSSNSKTDSVNNSEKISVVAERVKNVVEQPSNLFLPASTNVVQSNTYLLTNDGSLVQFPILNSPRNVFSANTNLPIQTAIVNQANSGLLTPFVINRPSPVIVLQKPAPQIIQTAQIVNPSAQILSVPNQNIQILGNSIVCATSTQNLNTKTLPYILSKQPPNKKRIAKDSTMTTYVNKIPIPALSKQSYVKKNVSLGVCMGAKGKNATGKAKDGKGNEKTNAGESEGEISVNEKEIQTEKCPEAPIAPSREVENENKTQETETRARVEEMPAQKRSLPDEENPNPKKQKLSEDGTVENVFKPIENPILTEASVPNDGLFCNLKLPNSMSHNLSVSPTAAFLSTFPIVASSKFEDELAGKMDERRTCEEKEPKIGEVASKEKEIPAAAPGLSEVSPDKGCEVSEMANVPLGVKESQPGVELNKEVRDVQDKGLMEKTSCDMNLVTGELGATADNPSSTNNLNNVAKDSNKNNISANNGSNVSNEINGGINQCSQLLTKSWEDYQQPKTCDVRSDPFYIHTEVQNSIPPPVIPDLTNSMSFPDPGLNSVPSVYRNSYPQNNMKGNFNVQSAIGDQMTVKNNQFDYGQKENFMAKRMNYSGDRNGVKKPCSNLVNDSYSMVKNQTPMYQAEASPNYQLIPVKEMSNQRNTRPPVNWMTDPDVRTRTMSYGPQIEKMATTAKIAPYTQPDIFYMNNQNPKPQGDIAGDYVLNDVNKHNCQKATDFYGNKPVDVQMKVAAAAPDQRCKNVEKRGDPKFPGKPPPTQNTYNIFDYNYNGNYFGEDDSNKFCNVQNFPANVKGKKANNPAGMAKKKSENAVHLLNGDQQGSEVGKRNPDQIISNLDFNPVGTNQECFSWVPGKNVEWLPSKSFVDTNLILPSTLPTLVGDLALGTTTSNEGSQPKGNRSNQGKTGLEGKSYIDVGLGNNAPFAKSLDPVPDNGNKQYLEPFANLSKNIFDLTPSNNVQNPQLPKNDCDKNGYLGNANETIVLKNIFELPVSKSFSNEFANRNKQRPVNNTQNNFLSVSQLVETPNYDSSMKNESSMENAAAAKQAESYSQNYSNYHGNQKSYNKNKARPPHYKYNDRKYHGYKNASSNYTAEALIRSNANLTYQNNEFQAEVNSGNFYAVPKPPQKADNFGGTGGKNEFEPIPKADFIPCSTQNIYSDFNFSSPVPNFNITTSVSTDYITHDGNYSAQNNTFFGDFIPPEYPITESVSNSLLLPPCSIGLQNPFIIEKRNGTPEKGGGKAQGKHCPNSRSRKNFDCSKTNYSDFSIGHHNASAVSSITCPTIFTTTSCQNLLPVPNQNIADPNITFSASSFTTSNITFPPLASNANSNYHRPATGAQNSTSTTYFPSSCPSMFTTCSTTTVSSSRTCLSTIPPTSSSTAVITTPFSVSNTFPSSTQSSLPFLSLSNPIIPPSVPSTSGNSLANFNLSTIFPEINQKGNYHYP